VTVFLLSCVSFFFPSLISFVNSFTHHGFFRFSLLFMSFFNSFLSSSFRQSQHFPSIRLST
jgi:hypothetical protein